MVDHDLRKLYGKMHNLMAFGKVVAVDDTGPVQRLQVRLDDQTLIDGVYAPIVHGVSSNPPIGSDVTCLAVAGDRSCMVAVAVGNKGMRHTGLTAGQVALYDGGGSTILLDGSGTVTIKAPAGIVLDTPMVSTTHELAAGTSGSPVHVTTHIHGGPGGNTTKPVAGS